jgi:hypothetical protein
MFIKLTNGTPETYTIGQLRRDNPQTSFPKDIPAKSLEGFDMYPVTELSKPDYDATTHYLKHSDFYQVGDKWQVHYYTEQLPEAQAASNVRSERNRRLTETDWMALSDNTITQEWADYRQALRDLTSQEGFPFDAVWPTKPN